VLATFVVMGSAVLVAEPESETREYLGRQLRDDGFDVLGAAQRSEALELASEPARPRPPRRARPLPSSPPGRAREDLDRNVPVILIAPTSDPVERVRALDRGADDVLGRPFAYEELLGASARSCGGRPSVGSRRGRDIQIDRATRRVMVRDVSVDLSAKEFELVVKLASEPYRVFTKEELLRQVWGSRRWTDEDFGITRFARPQEALRER